MKIKSILPFALLFVTLDCFSQQMNFEWAGRFGGNGEDVVRDLYVDAAGNSYTTGYFTDLADFDINENTESEISSNGNYDVFIQKTDAQGNLSWAISMGGNGYEYGVGITADDFGNVYVTGFYEGSFDCDPGANETILTEDGSGDIFIAKFTSTGEFVWGKSVGGTDYEESTAIDVDVFGNVIVIGYLYDSGDYDPGTGSHILVTTGLSDTFILKLDNNGEYVRGRTYGGVGFDLGLDMVIADNDDIYITGYYDNTADFDPGLGIQNIDHIGSGASSYVLHIDNEFNLLNVFTTIEGDVSSRGIDVDAQGNAYITGYFSGIADFDGDASNGSENTFSSVAVTNGFVLKVNAAGEFVWAKQFQSENTMFSFDIALGIGDQLYTCGYFDGTADFDPSGQEFTLTKTTANPTDAFFVALNTNGDFESAYHFGGAAFLDTHKIGTDANGNIYLSAHFELEIDLNPMSNEELTSSSIAFRDNYLIKMNSGFVGINETLQLNSNLYPNPTTNEVFVKNVKSLAGNKYTLYNSNGTIMKMGMLSFQSSIQTSDLAMGVYYVKIGEEAMLKFVKI